MEGSEQLGMDLKELMTQADERGGFGAVLDQPRKVLSMIEGMLAFLQKRPPVFNKPG